MLYPEIVGKKQLMIHCHLVEQTSHRRRWLAFDRPEQCPADVLRCVDIAARQSIDI